MMDIMSVSVSRSMRILSGNTVKRFSLTMLLFFNFFFFFTFYPFSQFVSCSPYLPSQPFFLYDCCTGINLNVFILFIFNVYV